MSDPPSGNIRQVATSDVDRSDMLVSKSEAISSVPKVWPVFLTYGIVLVGGQLSGVALFVLAVAAAAARNPTLARGEATDLIAHVTASPKLLLATGLVSEAILIAASLAGARLEREKVATRLCLVRQPLGSRFWIVTTIGFLGASQIPDSLFPLLGVDPGGSIELLTKVISSTGGPLLWLLLIVIGPVAGFAEEVFFRGYMQTLLRKRWNAWPAITVSAAAFGLLHLDLYHSGFAFLVGIFLGWIAVKAGTIYPAIVAHAFNNSVATLTSAFLPGPYSTTTNALLLVLSVIVASTSLIWVARWRRQSGERPGGDTSLSQRTDNGASGIG